jgi:hypothetical protein
VAHPSSLATHQSGHSGATPVRPDHSGGTPVQSSGVRYIVQLDHGGESLALKLANLKLVETMEPEVEERARTIALANSAQTPKADAAQADAAAHTSSSGGGDSSGLNCAPIKRVGPAPESTGFASCTWPAGEPVGSLAIFLEGPPGLASGLPQYAALSAPSQGG